MIDKAIHEIALKHCSDYPDIDKVNSLEQLYAISSTLEGVLKANDDCHRVIRLLAKKCNMSDDEIVESFYNKEG